MILVLIQLIMMMHKVYEMIGAGKDRGCIPVRKCWNEVFHEELKPTNLEDVYCRNFSVPSGTNGFYSKVYQGKAKSGFNSVYLSGTGRNTGTDLRMYRLSGTGYADCNASCRYTLGRSDLVRRAMSKKKGDVMARSVRASFMVTKKKA